MQAVPSAHKLRALCMAVDPHGRFIATAGNDHHIRLWDYTAAPPAPMAGEQSVAGPPPHQTFIGHPGPVLGEQGPASCVRANL